MRKSKIVLTLGVAAASLSGLFVSAPTASAAISNCPVGYACVWKNANYDVSSGGIVIIGDNVEVPNFNTGAYHFQDGSPVNDNITGIFNKTQHTIAVYTDANNGGKQCAILDPGWGYSDLSEVGCNDQVSSLEVLGSF